MSSETGWCTIESDPAVFSSLIEQLGATGFDVEEVYDLDPAGLVHLGRVFGLIFLFKWTPTMESDLATKKYLEDLTGVFFARQIVQNACATQAILSILMNLPEDAAGQIGDSLSGFRLFTSDFDPEVKGVALGEHEHIREVHNGFGRPEALYMAEDRGEDRRGGEDPFHFVSLMSVNGKLLEFDGLQKLPLILNETVDSDSWLRAALESVCARIVAMQAKGAEIRFNLMAVIQDRSSAIKKQLSELDDSTEWQRPELEAILAEDARKKLERSKDMKLRKHNFIPLIMGILEAMAKNRSDLFSVEK